MKYALDDFKHDVSACDRIDFRHDGNGYIGLEFRDGAYRFSLLFYRWSDGLHAVGTLYHDAGGATFKTRLSDILLPVFYNTVIKERDVEVMFSHEDALIYLEEVRVTHPQKFVRQKQENEG